MRCRQAALALMQSNSMQILPYLDNWPTCAPIQEQVEQDTAALLCRLKGLGLSINYTKSCLIPSQSVVFINPGLLPNLAVPALW